MKVGTYFCYQLCHPSRLFTKVLKVIKWEVVNSQSTKECLSLSMLPEGDVSKNLKVRLVMSVGFWAKRCKMYWKKNQLTTTKRMPFLPMIFKDVGRSAPTFLILGDASWFVKYLPYTYSALDYENAYQRCLAKLIRKINGRLLIEH